jgi:hypothetical protein
MHVILLMLQYLLLCLYASILIILPEKESLHAITDIPK